MMAIQPTRMATWLFYFNGGVWLMLAGVTLVQRFSGSNERAVGTLIAAILMIGNAIAMFAAGWGVGRHLRLAWVFGLMVLLVNIVLTFTDQVGWADWATFAVDAILVGVMMVVGRQLWLEARGR